MPCAMTSSSSTIRTFAILAPIMENHALEAERGRRLLEETDEIVLVLDEEDRLVAASRRALEAVDGLALGELVAAELLQTAALPSSDVQGLIEQAKTEVEQIRELIDDVLFLSELETGRAVVALTATRAAPVVREVLDGLAERASRAGVTLTTELDETAEVPLRPRMLRVVLANLAENTIRYAGDGVELSITVRREYEEVLITAADTGVGVSEADLPRLFERFYRADRARASRGTGLGLAIVKHIVTSAGGRVQASGRPGGGLQIRIVFSG